MAIDFYNLGLHPITMYQKEVKEDKQKSYKGRIYLTKDNFDSSIHIYSNEAMILTNERAKNLKKKIVVQVSSTALKANTLTISK